MYTSRARNGASPLAAPFAVWSLAGMSKKLAFSACHNVWRARLNFVRPRPRSTDRGGLADDGRVEFALRDRAAGARDHHAVVAHPAAHAAAARRQLIRHKSITRQPRTPIGHERTLGHAGHWILWNPVGGREEAEHIVAARARRCRDNGWPVEPGQRRKINLQSRDRVFIGIERHVMPANSHGVGRCAEAGDEIGRGQTIDRPVRRQLDRESGTVAISRELAAGRAAECDRSPFRLEAGEHDVCRGERRMPDERHLPGRGEPTDRVAFPRGQMNTVSDRLSSRAIPCLTVSERSASVRQTAAGLPPKGASAKASIQNSRAAAVMIQSR